MHHIHVSAYPRAYRMPGLQFQKKWTLMLQQDYKNVRKDDFVVLQIIQKTRFECVG